MKKLIVLLFGSLFLLQLEAQRIEEANVLMVPTDDKEMAAAIFEARATFDEFIKALKDKKGKDFFVKYPFEIENGLEHIWLSGITVQSNKIFGTIYNEPQGNKKIKPGQKVEINPKRISDWMYFVNEQLHGGITIILLINRMSIEERNAYKKALGIKEGN